MIRHAGRADRTEEDCVECPEFFESAFRDVITMLEIVIATPWKMFDREPEAALASGQHLQYLESCRDDFDADAIAGDGGDFVFAHFCSVRWKARMVAEKRHARHPVPVNTLESSALIKVAPMNILALDTSGEYCSAALWLDANIDERETH